MDNINLINRFDQLVVSSNEVSTNFGKEHKHVLEKLDSIKSDCPCIRGEIIESEYTNSRGRKYRQYLLTEKGLGIFLSKSRIELDKSNIEWLESINFNKDVIVIQNRKEREFGKMLKTFFKGVEIIEQLKILDYKIDFFIPDANLIIEYDEVHHKYQEKEDCERMSNIVNEIMNSIVEGYKLYDSDTDEPNPWLKGKDITSVVRVKEGFEIDGLRECLYAFEESVSNGLNWFTGNNKK